MDSKENYKFDLGVKGIECILFSVKFKCHSVVLQSASLLQIILRIVINIAEAF